MLEGLAGAVDDVTLGIESDRCLLDSQFELRALIGYVDMFGYPKNLFRTVLKGQNEQVGGLESVCKNTTKLYGYLNRMKPCMILRLWSAPVGHGKFGRKEFPSISS